MKFRHALDALRDKLAFATWLADWSIKYKLSFGFGLMSALLLSVVLISAGALWLTKQKFSRIIEQDAPVVMTSMMLAEQFKQAEAALGLYLLGHDDFYKQRYLQGLDKLEHTLAALKRLQPAQDSTAQWMDSLEKSIQDFRRHKDEILELAVDEVKNQPALEYAAQNLNPAARDILQGLSSLLQEERGEQNRMELLALFYEMRDHWLNVVNEVRGYMAFRGEDNLRNLELYATAFQDLEKHVAEEYAGRLSFIEAEELQKIAGLRETYLANMRQMIALHSSEQWKKDSYLIRTRIDPIVRDIDAVIPALVQSQLSNVRNANGDLLRLISGTIALMAAILLVSIAVATGGTLWLMRKTVAPLKYAVEVTQKVADGDLSLSVRETGGKDEVGQVLHAMQTMIRRLSGLLARIQESGVQLTSSTAQIAATAKQQESTVRAQAIASQEIRATSENISHSTQALAEVLNQVTHMAEQTADSAAAGHGELNRMEGSMRNMLQGTEAISAKLEIVKEKADNIGSVVTTIAKIADQTNLLSLNAAIQAEKAGEYGLGFSVVASEIRRLADQTAIATWDIEQIVKEMQGAVWGGVKDMQQFNEQVRKDVENIYRVSQQLAEIIGQVQALMPHFQAVREGMQSHAVSAQEINLAIGELSDSALETAESIAHSNDAIQQLKDAARGLHDGVSIFKVQRLTPGSF